MRAEHRTIEAGAGDQLLHHACDGRAPHGTAETSTKRHGTEDHTVSDAGRREPLFQRFDRADVMPMWQN